MKRKLDPNILGQNNVEVKFHSTLNFDLFNGVKDKLSEDD